jgi:hypothetical protein
MFWSSARGRFERRPPFNVGIHVIVATGLVIQRGYTGAQYRATTGP